ncbi:hypothetical protein C6341_g25487 [Phytophthora cactorum]|nr:hypothetical protein C6341_g25487 [Phytophthora cactorum]
MTKSSNPRGKGSALQEATESINFAAEGPNPRFAVREHSPGTVAEARAEHDGSHSEEAAGERTPLSSEGGRESVHSLGSDHGGHSPMCPADEAMDSSNTRTDEDEKPRREALETEVDPYKNLFGSDSDEEEEEGDLPSECGGVLRPGTTRQVTTACLLAKEEYHTREGIGLQSLAPVLSSTWSSSLLLVGHASKGTYERTLVQRNPLFTENIEAARCVLLAPHRIPLKEFTTRRKKPENRGCLHPVWGCPENCQSWGSADLLFWKWVASHSYSQEKLRELQQYRLLSYVLD